MKLTVLSKIVPLLLVVLLALFQTGCWSKVGTPGERATPLPSRPSPAVPSQPQPLPAPFNQGTEPIGVLRLIGADPLTLDPAVAQDITSWSYLLQIFSGLVSLDENLRVVPDLAESWRIDDSGRVYTFKLRENARFQNGRTVTASDFKYSIERAADPRLRSSVASLYLGDIVGVPDKLAGKTNEISGVKVLGDRDIQLTINGPKPYFLSKLTYSTAFVVDRENVAQGNLWWEKPNGTGPFKLKSWSKQQELRLEANDNYYGTKPKLAEVSYFLGSGSPMVMYERGQLDVVEVGAADIDRVTDPTNPLNKELVVSPQLDLWYIGFNTKMKPFDDPKVRQAFTMATDKERIVDVLLRKTGTKAEGILPPGLPGFKDARGLPFDPAKAKGLLWESTYGSPENLPPITLTTAGSGMGQTLAEMYQRNLGIEVKVEQVADSFSRDLEAGKYQMFYLGWVADYPDPEDFLDILFRSSSSGNHTGYSRADVDHLLDEAGVEQDEDRRWSLYNQAEEIIVQDAPAVPIFRDVQHVLVKPRIKGLKWTPIGILALKGVSAEGRLPAGTL